MSRPPILTALLRRAAAVAAVLGLAVSPAGAVVDGEVDPNALDSPWAGVGSVSVGAGTFSGTLIAPNYVLTAAHVVGKRAPAEITFNLNYGGDLTHRIRVEAVHVRPGYRGVVGYQPGGENDLAVLRLSEPVPAGVPIYGSYTDDLPQGSIVTFVGYGSGGMGAVGATEGARPEVKRVGTNVADCFAFTMGPENCAMPDLVGNGPKAIYLFDFDPPVTQPGQRPNGRLPVGEATLAGGDSGSPTFVYVQGQWRVAAVNTFVTRDGPNGRMSVFGTAAGGVLLTGANGAWIHEIIAPSDQALLPGPFPMPHVPEPRTWFLLGFGLLNVGIAIWRHWRPRARA
ncbi:MAG: trypsin-like serine protease [Betaproteobacteria bacterium]